LLPNYPFVLVRTVHREFGHIDVLINNAGIIQVAPLKEMDISDFEEAMKTNFWSAIYVTLAALPDMRASACCKYLVDRRTAQRPPSVAILLQQFAITGFSKGLGTEVARDGIVVTTICPGLMTTGSARNAYFKGKHRAEYTWFRISDALPFYFNERRASSMPDRKGLPTSYLVGHLRPT
jgi:NAD(P)-dependent dehydrogenase (short-subunit alcohol dehydrogenase family)